MKKFVVLQSSGTYAIIDGKTVIDCAVKSLSVYAESDDYLTLFQLCQKLENSAERYSGGVWHHYSVEKRAFAKRHLRTFIN